MEKGYSKPINSYGEPTLGNSLFTSKALRIIMYINSRLSMISNCGALEQNDEKLFDKTFLKFILVGIINTIVGASVMFISYNLLGFSYWLSSAANYVVGSIVRYFLNKYYTFKVKKRRWKYIFMFAANISICYLLAYSIAKPLMVRFLYDLAVSIQENVAMLVGMGLFVILNYFGQRFFIFKDTEQKR